MMPVSLLYPRRQFYRLHGLRSLCRTFGYSWRMWHQHRKKMHWKFGFTDERPETLHYILRRYGLWATSKVTLFLRDCQASANTVDGTVSGSCRVQQAFSSDNIYTCTWTRDDSNKKTFGGFDSSRELCSFTQPMPDIDGPYNYNIDVSPPSTTSFSKVIKIVRPGISDCSVTPSVPDWLVSGSCRVEKTLATVFNCSWNLQTGETFGGLNSSSNVCSFSQSLPYNYGNYTYTIRVFPNPMKGFAKEINIASPGDLSIFYPRVVLEGSSFVVACETETAGSPPAIVRLEGEKDRQKVISSVPRTANGTQFRCHVTWGGVTNSTNNYTLLVAYGPQTVSIVNSSPSNSANTTLFCSASEAYPKVVYSWKGACVNVTDSVGGSTCLVSQQISDSDVITCTAANSLFDISVTASCSLGTQSPVAAAVGGAIAGVIVLTVISVVAVVCYLKKRKDGTYARTTRGREEPHPYMDLEIRGEGEGHSDTPPSSSG